MKILIDSTEIEVIANPTYTAPMGATSWIVSFCIDGIALYSHHIESTYAPPNPFFFLGELVPVKTVFFQDIHNPIAAPSIRVAGDKIHSGFVDSRPAWWRVKDVSVRDLIRQSLVQIV